MKMHLLHFFVFDLLDCLTNEFLIFKGRNLDQNHLLRIQWTMYKEKVKKRKKMLLIFCSYFFSLSAYLYADLETGWLATGISGCVS